MKKLFLFAFLFILGATTANAQSFGIKGGLNFANLTGDDSDGFKGLTSFHIGGVAELRVFQNLALQPELLFSTQGAKVENEQYKLNYLSLPVMAKFYLNDALSVQAGPTFGVLLSQTKNVAVNDTNTFDFGLAGGLEYKIIGGLFVQGRYGVGFTDMAKDANVRNSVIQLSIGYLF